MARAGLPACVCWVQAEVLPWLSAARRWCRVGREARGASGLEHRRGLVQELALVLCCGNVTAAGCFLFQATVSPAATLQSTDRKSVV